jgi:hypothetical protein
MKNRRILESWDKLNLMCKIIVETGVKTSIRVK